MNLKELDSLDLHPKTLDDIEIDLTRLIVRDEFNKPTIRSRDYRLAAIERLVKIKRAFSSEHNILVEMANLFIAITCPYCAKRMEYKNAGGSSSLMCIHYACECGAESSLTLDNYALGFTPPKTKAKP